MKFRGYQDSKNNSVPLTGTLLVFESGKINSVEIKRPNHFLELDKWIESKIDYV